MEWWTSLLHTLTTPSRTPLLEMSGAMAQAMPDGQSWHHFTPSIYGSSHARLTALAFGGLGYAVTASVHHERSLPPSPGTGGADAEGVGLRWLCCLVHVLLCVTARAPTDNLPQFHQQCVTSCVGAEA